MFDQWTLKKKLALPSTAILPISVALVNTGKLLETVRWNAHTYNVLKQSEKMLLDMVNIETSFRGFVASGDERFLEPFKQGQEGFSVAFNDAKKLTSDNAIQQDRLVNLMTNYKQFMEVANSLSTMRPDVTAGKRSQEDLFEEFNVGKDKASMDAFRS